MRAVYAPWPGEDYRVIRASSQRGLVKGRLYRVVALEMEPIYPGMTRARMRVTLAPLTGSNRIPASSVNDVEIQTDTFWKFFAGVNDESEARETDVQSVGESSN